MTSNIGSDEFNSQAEKIGFLVNEKEEAKIIADYDTIREKVMKQLPEFFSPEFLNRIDKTIVFNPLDKKVLKNIIGLQLEDLIARLALLAITCTFDTKAVNVILEKHTIQNMEQDQSEDLFRILLKMLLQTTCLRRKKKNITYFLIKKELSFSWK